MSDRAFHLALLTLLLVVAIGLPLDVMEVDAAQYAGMSRDMMERGDVLKLYYRHADYLDKPPLLFWLSSLSFHLFGVSDVSYRLPSVLFALLGLFSLYRFTLLYYEKAVARNAVLMFGGSAAFFIMTNDVRCDTMLTGSVMTAIWLGCAWLRQGRWWQLIGGGIAIGAGMLAKGPLGAVAPLMAIGGQVVFTGQWKRLRDPRALALLPLVFLVLLPMCIGLYEQHGAHGLRFYFWEQSFGRITGENRWKDDSTVLYFTHEILWQLLPWILFVLLGLWNALRSLFSGRPLAEYASLTGAVLVFVAISLSQFKLPHYLFVALPLFAVLGAVGCHSALSVTWVRIQYGLVFLLWSSAMAICWITFPESRWLPVAVLSVAGVVFVIARSGSAASHMVIFMSFYIVCAIGVVMNGHFYPNLLRYQANAKAGQWAAEQALGPGRFFTMQVSGGAIDYYAGYPVPWLSNASEARDAMAPNVVIYTDAKHRQQLLDAGLVPTSEVELVNYPVQRLGIPFLFPDRRAALLEPRFLLRYH